VLREPSGERVGEVDTCVFEFRRSDGEARVDYLFAIGDRGFAVLAGGTRDYEQAREAAVYAIETLRVTG
jgi:hypothetical protein